MLFETIDSFWGDYRFLSNFYPSPFVDDVGYTWPTVEHYYQAQKALNVDDFNVVAACKTPGQAKRAGSKVEMRPDWDQVKTHIMFGALRWKFEQNPDLAQKLIDTGDAELVEGNTWGDVFWGYDTKLNKGQNVLGQQLMILRGLLNERSRTEDKRAGTSSFTAQRTAGKIYNWV